MGQICKKLHNMASLAKHCGRSVHPSAEYFTDHSNTKVVEIYAVNRSYTVITTCSVEGAKLTKEGTFHHVSTSSVQNYGG